MATAIKSSLNPNIKPSIINFGGFAFSLDGDNIPYYFNKNDSWIWMHIDPTTTPTEVHSAAGAMSAIAGGMTYFYTEIHRASGDTIHSCHETNPSPVSVITGDFTSKKVVLTLPATGVNTFCSHLKIYGTEDGGSIYYYLGNVAIGTTTFDDDNIARDATVAFGKLTTAADATVDQTYYNYPVKNHCYSVATKTRILACGVRPKTDGTADFTAASAAVVGHGTLWTRALEGDYIVKDGDTRPYQVLTVSGPEALTLAEVYAGSTSTGDDYVIQGPDDIVRWTAKHPLTAVPMWWAFPVDFHKRIVSKDDSPTKGCNKIGNQPVIFKEQSHYLLTENGDDFIVEEARTKVGTGSHRAIAETSEIGSLIFPTHEGLIYESNGLEAKDLGIDLSKTVDGINTARLAYSVGVWLNTEKWYIFAYSKKGSSVNDRILVYDYELKEYVIWAIEANCMAIIESSESGQTVYKPWIGSVGGFVYKMLTGNSLGSGSTGTLSGTVTGTPGAAYIDDSAAAFYTTGDGHKDVYVSLYNAAGVYQEQQKILSNTTTRVTADTNWTTTPVAGWTYEIGSIRFHWKSKVFDFDTDLSKSIDKVLMNFKKVATERNVDIKFYVSEDPTMPDDADQTITFDLQYDYYEPVGLKDNRARYFQFEISGHGVNKPVVVNNMMLDISQLMR